MAEPVASNALVELAKAAINKVEGQTQIKAQKIFTIRVITKRKNSRTGILFKNLIEREEGREKTI